MFNRGGGRKQDDIWRYFKKSVTFGKTGCRATCISCNKEMQGLVKRMKDHFEACQGNGDSAVVGSSQPTAPVASSQPTAPLEPATKKRKFSESVGNYFTKTTESEKKALDLQVARTIFATNSSFNFADHPEFIKLCSMLRPGYHPPSPRAVGTTLLDEVHEDAFASCKEKVKGKVVSMELDGWSNIHHEPIVCCSITTHEGDTFLTSTIDTGDERHTGDNLEVIAEKAIKQVEENLECTVSSFVTDNASNMKKCRNQLEDAQPIITYPCSAHILDRLAKDVDTSNIKSDIVTIAKYFRNHHLPNAWYKQEGGKKLQIPCDVRWNSVSDCFQGYLDNWATLVKVAEAHCDEIDPNIYEKVLDMDLKHQAMEYQAKMKPIAIALDKLQRNNCHLSDAVVIWKELQETFEGLPVIDLMKLDSRLSTALTPAHLLAYLLDPRYYGSPHLTNEEISTAMKYLSEHQPSALLAVIKYRAKSSPFESYMFTPELLKKIDPLTWWKSQASLLDENILSLVEQLHTARASTAGIERIFSTFGFVHSKIRNRLQTDKAAKLVFMYKLFNM